MKKDKFQNITIFTDFDGVLFDTLNEAYVLCQKSFHNIDIFKPIEQDSFKKFARYKFLVFNSWQYLYLMKCLDNKNLLRDEDFINKYKSLLNNRNTDEEKAFEKRYLDARTDLIKNQPQYIDQLESKFPFFDNLKSISDKVPVIIISQNNYCEISRKLEKEQVFNIKIIAKEQLKNYKNKAEFIEEYIKKNNIKESYFIDDNSHNLNPCKDIKGLTCLLAEWGNHNMKEHGLNQDEIFEIIKNLTI